MRILAIRGCNLASLERTFSLNFREEPLRSAGLFAITGPTGSGKSTILDAICLALFDRVPRLQHGKESGAYVLDASGERLSSSDPRVLLRKGAAEGYAEVEFLGVDGKEYLARWEVRRAARRERGRLQASRLSLHDLALGQCLAQEGKGECLALIGDKLGLGFEQFTRAVLLAQGDFAKFLQAKTSEKAELLERLTNSEEYARISRAIYELNGKAQGEVEDIERRLELLRGVSDEELHGLHRDLASQSERVEGLQEQDRAIRGLIDQQLHYLQEREVEREAEQHAAMWQRRVVELAPDRELLQRWDEAQGVREVAMQCAQIGSFLGELQMELEALAQSAQRVQREYQEALRVVEIELASLEQLVDRGKALDLRLAEAAVREEGLRHLRQQAHEREGEWRAHEAKRMQLAREREEHQRAFQALSAHHAVNGKRLRELDRGLPLFAEDGAAIDLLARYQQHHQAYAQHKKQIERLAHERSACAAAEQSCARELEVLLGSVDPTVLALRKGLCAGEACPVCGATEHPYAHRLDMHTMAHTEQSKREKELVPRLEQLKQRGEGLKEEEMQARGAAEQCAADREGVREQIDRKLSAMQLQWRERVEGDSGWVAEVRSAYQRWKELRERVEQEGVSLEHSATQLRSLALQEEEASKGAGSLLERFEALRGQCQAEQEALAALLDGKSIRQLKAEFDTELAKRTQAHEAAQAAVQHVVAAQHALAGRQSQLETQRQQAMERRANVHAALQAWLAAHPHVESAEVLHELLSISPESASAKRQALQEAEMGAVTSRELLGAARSRLAQYDEERLLQHSPQMLEDQKRTIAQDLDAARSAADALRTRIAQEEDKRARAAELRTAWLVKREDATHWQRLNELYGSADGARFRVIAQYYTLEALLRYANQHLGYIMPRYRIEPIPTTSETARRSLALQIVDTELLNESRPTDTLSGGETFLVSLALSLALSAFTSSAYSIESLFIDEGFGSLDPESLGLALTALERLQMQGRKVGLISHVQEMNERIAVKVHVRKVGGGRSVVEVESF